MADIKCDSCPLHENVKTVCLGGEGPEDADLMFIGEAPGADEDRHGRPFIGRAGRFLRKNMMLAAGIDHEEVYISNSVRCRPPGNKTPNVSQIKKCRVHLEEEIKRVKPKVCILLGNGPLTSIIYNDAVKGITKWRGKAFWSQEFGCWMIATFHPSALSRDRNMGIQYRYYQSIDDLELAVQLISRKNAEVKLPKWKLIDNPRYLVKYLQAVQEAVAAEGSLVAIDLETDRFDPRNEILGVSMCFKRGGKYYPVYWEWNTMLDSDAACEMFSDILLSKRIQKVFHNVAFDDRFLRWHGYRMDGPVLDTMIGLHLLDENFSTALKDNTWTRLGFGGYELPLERYKFDNKFRKNTSYKKFPLDVLAPYAAMDAYATYRLYEEIKPELQDQQLLPLFEKVSCPVRRVISDAEEAGFMVDVEAAKELSARLEAAQEKMLKRFFKLAGQEFNLRSTQKLGKVLFEDMGLKHVGKTKSGQYKVDEKSLKIVAKQRATGVKLVQSLLQYRSLGKLQSTYVNAIEKHVWKDGRVRSSFKSNGTVTGRISNEDPCTHNIPNDRLIRSLYVASPGCKLVHADIKAAELRAIGLHSREPVFLKAFKDGVDIHNTTYRAMFDKPEDYVPTDTERRLAKIINFGLIYGVTVPGLAANAGISKAEAAEFMQRYFARLPKIRQYLKYVVRHAKKHGYVISCFKRRRRLPEMMYSDDDNQIRRLSRQAQNAPIQSSAADFTYVGLIRVSKAIKKAGLSAKIVHTVHDCIIVDTPDAEIEAVSQIIREAFQKSVRAFPLKMEVDLEVESRWGEHKESKLEKLFEELNV